MFKLVDAHCDTIVRMMDEKQALYDNDGHVSIQRLQKYESPVQFFALCIADHTGDAPYQWLNKHIALYHDEIQKNSAHIGHANTYQDILDNEKSNKISGILAIEGAEVLEGSIDNLHQCYENGVRSINITWNYNNHFGCSSEAEDKGGLTDLGKAFVKEMNTLGIIIDVSHLSEKGFWQVCDLSAYPIIASHSNAYALSPVTRNLKDEQLKAIGEKGGVVGLNLCSRFLDITDNPGMDHVMRHLDKMLSLAGEDNVGLGCDFDGIQTPKFELNNVSAMDILYERCIRAFGKDITVNIFSNNFMRVLQKILG